MKELQIEGKRDNYSSIPKGCCCCCLSSYDQKSINGNVQTQRKPKETSAKTF